MLRLGTSLVSGMGTALHYLWVGLGAEAEALALRTCPKGMRSSWVIAVIPCGWSSEHLVPSAETVTTGRNSSAMRRWLAVILLSALVQMGRCRSRCLL